ncbi:MAG TPA: FtsX-like permease family protein, partial [Candidatus Angelobacter sp.]|nr:FtsX-like permease family protein [Candidatus Angelobacter sp.]
LRQLLTESLVLSITGGALGIVLASLAIRAFLAFGPGELPRLEEVGINGTVLLFTVIVCVGSGIMFGLAPAFETSRTSADEGLKDANRTSSSASAHRIHNALVIAEVAIALLLMIGSGLLVRSFVRLQAVDPGIRQDHLITARITLSRSYETPDQIRNFWKQFLQRVEGIPGVHSAGISMSIPPNLIMITNPFTVEGQGYDRNRPLQLAEEMTVSSGYFRAAGIPLLKGRLFTPEDKVEGKNAQQLLIINDTMAKKFFPNQDPIGRRLQTGDPDPKSPWETIIGVVGDVKYSGLDAPPAPTLYVPFNDEGWATWSYSMYLLVQTETDPASIVPALRRELASMDTNLPLARVRTMDRVVEESVVQERFRTWLVGSFAAIALLLATIGIYGVISYSVSQRTREIGVRMALGALKGDVLKLVLSQGLRLVGVGLIIGIVGSLLATRLMGTLLFGVTPTDLVSYVAMSLVLCLIALLACFIPAQRAMKVDPTVALRYE